MSGEKRAGKRFYWLKLPNDYFKRLDQRKMLRQPNGETMQRIYLKLLLLAVDKDGFIRFQNVFDDLTEEIAEEIFEDVELVKQTVEYCKKNSLLEMNELDFFLPQVIEMTGSETDSARRMRKHRVLKALQDSEDEVFADNDGESCPTLEEIRNYIETKGIKKFTAEEFYYYNKARGWIASSNIQIVDWKALIHSWESSNRFKRINEMQEEFLE